MQMGCLEVFLGIDHVGICPWFALVGCQSWRDCMLQVGYQFHLLVCVTRAVMVFFPIWLLIPFLFGLACLVLECLEFSVPYMFPGELLLLSGTVLWL